MNNEQEIDIKVDATGSNDNGLEDSDVDGFAEEIEAIDSFAEIERLQVEVAEQQDKYQRAVADLANYRRRKELESSRLIQQARDNVLSKFLPVVDDFERAIQTSETDHSNEDWVEGFRLIEKKLWSVFEAEGVRPMTSVGQLFDPKLHDAVMVDSDSADPDTVVEEFQRGYFIGDRVLRPAVVKVGSNTAQEVNKDNE